MHDALALRGVNPLFLSTCFTFEPKWRIKSVLEMPDPGEDHHHPVLIRRGDQFFVLHRSAGLDYRRDAHFCCLIHVIAEWEEGVGGECGTLDRKRETLGPHRGDADGIDAVHLA